MSVNVEIAEIVVNAALEAGRAIMKIYDSADFGIEMKADKSEIIEVAVGKPPAPLPIKLVLTKSSPSIIQRLSSNSVLAIVLF